VTLTAAVVVAAGVAKSAPGAQIGAPEVRILREWLLALGIGMLAASSLQAAPARFAHPTSAAPDLSGLWTNASYTKLERPREFSTLIVDGEAARAYEAKLASHHGVPSNPAVDTVGQADSEYLDSGDGLARIGGQLRSSWIVDPADGRLPYTAEARRRLATADSTDNPEQRPGFERCVVSPGSVPPMLSSNDDNLFQFVQTAHYLAIVAEKDHDVRIIPLGHRADPAPRGAEPASWSGNSVGRWEGRTLVVETTGFRADADRWPFLYQSRGARVVERFTRSALGELLYDVTVDDPATFTRPWRAEMLFRATKGPLLEYACHEGNRSIVNILAGARRADAARPAS
jgi:hypothetical protein